MSCMRHVALDMLRAETTKKASIRRKQKIAAMRSCHLDKVLLASFNGVNKKRPLMLLSCQYTPIDWSAIFCISLLNH